MLKRVSKIGVFIAGLTCLAPVILVLFGIAGGNWLPIYIDYIRVLALALVWGMIVYTR